MPFLNTNPQEAFLLSSFCVLDGDGTHIRFRRKIYETWQEPIEENPDIPPAERTHACNQLSPSERLELHRRLRHAIRELDEVNERLREKVLRENDPEARARLVL